MQPAPTQSEQLAEIFKRLEFIESPRLAYTIAEAVKVTGCSHDAISRAVVSKSLPARKIGARWIITRDALVRWLSA